MSNGGQVCYLEYLWIHNNQNDCKGVCVIMALAMLIVSTENGRNSCSVISASEAEAAEALTAVKSEPHFIGIGTEKAITYMARAWEVCGQHYEALPLQDK